MLGTLESRVLRVLWAADRPLTVREVVDAVSADGEGEPAYTTVLTVMTRLTEKGVLTRSPDGRRHRYRPVVRDEAALAVRGLLRDYGDAAVSHFVEQTSTDPELRRRLRRLVEDLE